MIKGGIILNKVSRAILRAWFNALDNGLGRYIVCLPALIIILFCTPVGAIMWEILTGNLYFYVEWYENNTWGATYFWLFVTNEAVFKALLPYVVTLIVVILIIIFMIHLVIWRLFFKSYNQVRDNTKTFDGRIYYSYLSSWARMGKRLRMEVGVKDPNPNVAWFYVNRNTFLNVFTPFNSMTKIVLNPNVQYNRMLYDIDVIENRSRKFKAIFGIPCLFVCSDDIAISYIDNQELFKLSESSLRDNIITTQKAVHANVLINKEVVRREAFQIPEQDLKKFLEDLDNE